MKRQILLTLAATILALPALARDFEYTYEGQTVKYTVVDEDAKTCEVAKYNKISGALILPANPSDSDYEYTLVGLGDYAFRDCSSLTEITIPNSVTSIGNYAFRNCSSLTEITIPNSVTSIGESAFSICSSLTEIIIPNSVTSIGYSAFNDCYSLTDITIPNSVSSISDYAFFNCRSLTKITIPNSVTSIGESAFSICSSLTEITIPNSVTSIGDKAFKDCRSLTEINVDTDNAYYSSIDGVLFNKDCTILIQYPCANAKTVCTIPNSVTSIGSSAFYYCSSLTDITIPNSVISIGDNAFSFCSSLTEITISNSVTSIGNSTFSYCSSLTDITIPNSVTSIGEYAFRNCSSLTEITIPDSVTSIDSSAFSYCSSLTEITIPNSVTSIGQYAFYYCSSLTEITIPDSVTYIGQYAFNNCSSLTSIISNALTPPSGGYYLLSNYKDITLYVPEQSVDAYKAAQNWRNFTNIIGFRTVPFEATISGLHYVLYPIEFTAVVTYAAQNSLCNYEGMQLIIVPETVDFEDDSYKVISIGEEAFNNSWGLKSVTLPSTLQSIGKLAFGYCTSLRSVVIPDEVTVIDDEAFTGCSALASVTIGGTVETIGDYAFFGCTGLSSINVPESVKNIGENAFMGVHWINEVHAESDVPAEAPVSAFSTNAYRNATLVVPDGALSTYKSHPTWSNFLAIREEGNSTTDIMVVEGAIIVRGADSVRIYNPSGVQIYSGKSGRIELPSGIYLVVTDSVSRKVRL